MGGCGLSSSPSAVDLQAGRFTDGYDQRFTDGFTNPNNKENLTALWLIALHKHGQTVYRERAEKWCGDEVADEAARRRPVLRLELLGTRRALGLQAGRLAKHWIGVHPKRRLLWH